MLSGLVEKAIKSLVNAKLGKAGSVKSLSLDKKTRCLQLSVDFEGEPDEIAISLQGYQIIDEDDQLRVAFEDIQISRPWMESLLKRYKPDLSFRLPASARQAVKMALS
ncbi:MAG: hypothetical protein ACPGYX_05500 [Oceanobacter sp.]